MFDIWNRVYKFIVESWPYKFKHLRGVCIYV